MTRAADPEPFEVRTAKQDGHWVVAVQGELDLATVGTLEAYLNGVGRPVVVDLANVSFIDSAGIALLLSAIEGRAHRWGRIPRSASGVPNVRFGRPASPHGLNRTPSLPRPAR